MNYGYDTISNGSSIAMPAFIISFGAVDEATGSLYLPSIWTSLWTSMTNLGQAIGAFMAGALGQTIGRRYTAMIFAVMSVAGTFLLFFATSRGMLLVGKIINGAVVGGLMSLGTTYAADVCIHISFSLLGMSQVNMDDLDCPHQTSRRSLAGYRLFRRGYTRREFGRCSRFCS